MGNIFINILNISIMASWLVLVVLVIRAIFKNAPKWIICLMWLIVGLRLVFPFSIESALSLIPSENTVPNTVITEQNFSVDTGFDAVDERVNTYFVKSSSDNYTVPDTVGEESESEKISSWEIASYVWLGGVALMVFYMIISYARMKKKLRTSTLLVENIYQSEFIKSPFVMGIINPKIYIPYEVDMENIDQIIMHEKAHLKRYDNITKVVAFIILSVYWFNPVIWVAFAFLCKDMEYACDEKVIKLMEKDDKQNYAKAILDNSVKDFSVVACPFSFGGENVSSRIRRIMNYKKPRFWVVVCSIILCVAITICFITVPKSEEKDNKNTNASNEYNNVTVPDENNNTSTSNKNDNTGASDENNNKNNTAKNNNTSVEEENDVISVSDEYIVWSCMSAGDVWDYNCCIELDFEYTKILCECTQGKMLYNEVEDESGFYLYDSAKKVEYKYGEKILWEPKSHGPFNTPPEIKLTVYNGDEIIHTGTIVVDFLKEVIDDDFDEYIDRYDWYYSAKMIDSDGMYLQKTDIDNYPDILVSSNTYDRDKEHTYNKKWYYKGTDTLIAEEYDNDDYTFGYVIYDISGNVLASENNLEYSFEIGKVRKDIYYCAKWNNESIVYYNVVTGKISETFTNYIAKDKDTVTVYEVSKNKEVYILAKNIYTGKEVRRYKIKNKEIATDIINKETLYIGNPDKMKITFFASKNRDITEKVYYGDK